MTDRFTETTTLARIPNQPGRLAAEVEYVLPSAMTELEFHVPDSVRAVRATGFRVRDGVCVWEDGDRQDPSVRYVYHADNESEHGGYGFVDTGTWAITGRPSHSLSITYRGSVPELTRRYQIEGPGAISGDGAIAYLGPHDHYARTAPMTGEAFELVVPEVADPSSPPDAILTALCTAAERLDIGGANTEILAIAAPSGAVVWAARGQQRGDDGFWVRDDARVGDVNEGWVHEYVHTRQTFRPTEQTEWFVEGTADYFSSWSAVYRCAVSFDLFHRYMRQQESEASVLADPTTWESRLTPYRQGRRACAALDATIRDATDHDESLATVVAVLNETVGDAEKETNPGVTNDAIAAAVEDVLGWQPNGWFDGYVYGSHRPPIPESREPFGLG